MTKKNRKPFDEAVYSAFYDCFRVAGFTPTISQLDRMRNTTGNLAKILEAESKMVAIELINRVQDHLKSAFADLGQQVDKIQERLDNTVKRVDEIQKHVDTMRRTGNKPQMFKPTKKVDDAEKNEQEAG